ncbi:putative enoyl-CoA hydratase echA8 [bioreactor metagenome]|uniref:Putative enoyl-CoA hydratase echA8 n=1 Tax=bioreactor metagenome TaxID=1076179 RepID=A0A644X8S3_9ZZZZ
MYEFEKIKFEVQDRIALIDLNSPQTMNRLYAPFFRDLHKAADIIDSDDGIFVAVVTGGEKVFCTGDDVTQPEELKLQKDLGLFEWMKIVQDCMTRISYINKPIIAAVAGYTLGGGLEMAMACDFIVASENTKMGLTEAKLGVFPCGGGTQRLPRLVGKPLAKEIIFTGDFVDAKHALEIGLVNRIYPEGHLVENALALARKICEKTSPATDRLAKHAIDGGCATDMENGLYIELSDAYRAGFSPDKDEGLKAFSEKRAPVWSGKMF